MKTAIAIALACAAGAGCGGSPTSPSDGPTADAASAADAAAPDGPASPDAMDLSDAMPAPDLSCLGQAAATAAPDPVVASGKVFAIVDYRVQALANAPVGLRRLSDDGVLGSATTGADGSFSISVASGGAAIEAYFLVDDGVHRPTYGYPEAPLTGAHDALLIVADDAELSRWYADAGDTWDATARTIIGTIADCSPVSVPGSVGAAPAPAKLVYYDPSAQVWDPALTASANGFALLTRAAATVDVTAHVGGHDYPVHALVGHAGALSLAVLPPTQ